MADKFKIGDLVWAKMKGFPAWPGKVIQPKAEVRRPSGKKTQQFIFFFGSENYAWIPEDTIYHYAPNRNRFQLTQRIPRGFKEAIEAVDDELKSKPQMNVKASDLPSIEEELAAIFPARPKDYSRESGRKRKKHASAASSHISDSPSSTASSTASSSKQNGSTPAPPRDRRSTTRDNDTPATRERRLRDREEKKPKTKAERQSERGRRSSVDVQEKNEKLKTREKGSESNGVSSVPQRSSRRRSRRASSINDDKVENKEVAEEPDMTEEEQKVAEDPGMTEEEQKVAEDPGMTEEEQKVAEDSGTTEEEQKVAEDSGMTEEEQKVAEESDMAEEEQKGEAEEPMLAQEAVNNDDMVESKGHASEEVVRDTSEQKEEDKEILEEEQEMDFEDGNKENAAEIAEEDGKENASEVPEHEESENCAPVEDDDEDDEVIIAKPGYSRADHETGDPQEVIAHYKVEEPMSSDLFPSDTNETNEEAAFLFDNDHEESQKEVKEGEGNDLVAEHLDLKTEEDIDNSGNIAKSEEVVIEQDIEYDGKSQIIVDMETGAYCDIKECEANKEILLEENTEIAEIKTEICETQEVIEGKEMIVEDVDKIVGQEDKKVEIIASEGEEKATKNVGEGEGKAENIGVEENEKVGEEVGEDDSTEGEAKVEGNAEKREETKPKIERRISRETPAKGSATVAPQKRVTANKRASSPSLVPAAKKSRILGKATSSPQPKTVGSIVAATQEVRPQVAEVQPAMNIIPTPMKIGFLGLGIMGQGMVNCLLKSGHEVTVWNRTPQKCRDFVKDGALKGNTPAEVVAGCDITFSCVADPTALKDLVFGNSGVLQGIGPKKGYIDMSTVDVDTITDVSEAVIARGGRFLEAPVCGSKNPAISGQLVILASGDRTLYEDAASCFEAIGKKTFFLGETGNGVKMKLVVNMLMGTVLAGLAESMSLAEKVGLDQDELLQVLDLSALSSPLINSKGTAIMSSKFETNFPLQHQQKDLRLAINMADAVDQPLYVGASANELFKKAKAKGYGEHDVAAVYRAADM